jgi:hypothetical protein
MSSQNPPLPNDATLAERLVACYVALERIAKFHAFKDVPSLLSKEAGMSAGQIGYGKPGVPLSSLEDASLMPFGKYKGRVVACVPASYFFWLWTNADDPMSKKTGVDPVADYIKKNLETLKSKYPDGIWE